MKKSQSVVVITIISVLLIWILTPYHLKKAIVHQLPGIYDYLIFHNRTIDNDSPQAWPKSKKYNFYYPPESLQDSIELMETSAFLIIQNDSLLYEYYQENLSGTELSNSFSMAKSIVSLLIGCAIEDGYINLNQTIEELLPDFTQLHGHGLTLKHLLNMSSGSNWNESYNSAFSVTTKAYYGNDLKKMMKKVKITQTPGKTFSYSSGDTQLLAIILSENTGMSISEYVYEKLWKQMGAESKALWSLDKKDGFEKAYCCFNSIARDFARIGHLVLNNGKWNNEQLIPENYMQASLTPALHLIDEDSKHVDYYGFQWWILNYRGEKIPYARGILGQYIFVIPHLNAVIVRLGHQRSDSYIGPHTIDAFTWLNTGINIITQSDSKPQ